MKKGILFSVSIFLAFALTCIAIFAIPIKTGSFLKQEPEAIFTQEGKNIYKTTSDGKERFEIKGVNMGSGYPGAFPNDNKISKQTYYNWLEKISEMNANTIRVYKLHPPEFYSALYQYNKKHDKKLYIIQTVDFPEEMMFSEDNIALSKNHNKLFKSTQTVIDAIHGNKLSISFSDDTAMSYVYDVSQYVVGYLLGIEWDESFVEYTSKINYNTPLYQGEYFMCKSNASPFESFLASWGDFTLGYENDKYNEQHLISFGNWAETDPFINDIKITETELESVVDSEHLVITDKVKNGFFVSYNIYPYYPLFLQYGDYIHYVDESGHHNPYRKYLTELVEYHSYPVVVSEYGIPSSRSVAHKDIWRKFSHGGLNEKEQAKAVSVLYDDIKKAGCAGSLVFKWQDEWYKSAWNEMTLSDPNGRAFWNNVQCAEQCFGVLAFDPSSQNETLYPDGDITKWNKKDIVYENDNLKLSLKYDEKYLHILVSGLDMRKDKSYVNIAFDINPKGGHNKVGNKSLSRKADFLIKIDKNGKSALYVDNDYDVLAYSVLGVFHGNTIGSLLEIQNSYKSLLMFHPESKDFNIVARADDSTYNMITSDSALNYVGILKKGNANPTSKSYDSNADYFIKDNVAEIRIPWQLLNFYNPPEGKIIDIRSSTGYTIKGLKIDKIYASAYYDDETDIDFGAYKLKKWNNPTFHERLKPVYYSLQKAFGEVN